MAGEANSNWMSNLERSIWMSLFSLLCTLNAIAGLIDRWNGIVVIVLIALGGGFAVAAVRSASNFLSALALFVAGVLLCGSLWAGMELRGWV